MDGGKRAKFMNAAFETFLRDTSDIVFLKDDKLVYVGCSRTFAEITRFDSPEDIIGRTDEELFEDRELAKRYVQDDRNVLASGVPLIDSIEPLPKRNGRARYGSTSKALIYDDEGKVLGVYGVSKDVTAQYEAKLNYDRELEYLFVLGEDVCVALLFDLTDWCVSQVEYGTKKCCVIPNFDTVEAYMKNAADAVLDNEQIRDFYATFTRERVHTLYQSGKRNLVHEYLRSAQDGCACYVRNEIHFLMDPISNRLSMVIIQHDVDSQRRAQAQLLCAAEQDSMTKLLNHDATMRHIEEFLRHDGAQGQHAVFMIDIDNFKEINDTFGHQKGDEAIVAISSAIQKTFRDSDIVGRIGGDEFFVLMKNCAQRQLASKKAADMLETVRSICVDQKSGVCLSGSVGVSLYPLDGDTLQRLYCAADAALYDTKHSGKNGFTFFERNKI